MNMIGTLKEKYGDNYDIAIISDSSHFCPFSGGGDVGIFKTGSISMALLQGEASPDETPQNASPSAEAVDSASPNQPQVVTPPRTGEYRCGSVENKVSSTQKEESVSLQLQANMLLLCSRLLVDKINEMTDVETLTCYGVHLGATYKLKLLKLTLDFSKENIVYEEIFTLEPCAFYPAFIDISIFHVFQSLV